MDSCWKWRFHAWIAFVLRTTVFRKTCDVPQFLNFLIKAARLALFAPWKPNKNPSSPTHVSDDPWDYCSRHGSLVLRGAAFLSEVEGVSLQHCMSPSHDTMTLFFVKGKRHFLVNNYSPPNKKAHVSFNGLPVKASTIWRRGKIVYFVPCWGA